MSVVVISSVTPSTNTLVPAVTVVGTVDGKAAKCVVASHRLSGKTTADIQKLLAQTLLATTIAPVGPAPASNLPVLSSLTGTVNV